MDDLFEVSLRPTVAAEQELIEALKAENAGLRGGITELLRACVHRGYAIVQEHAISGMRESDAGVHVDFAPAGAYRFKLLAMFRAVEVAAEQPRPASAIVRSTASIPVPAAPAVAPAAAPVIAKDDASPHEPPQSEREASTDAASADDAKPKPNWGRFRGIAGFDGPKGGSS